MYEQVEAKDDKYKGNNNKNYKKCETENKRGEQKTKTKTERKENVLFWKKTNLIVY